MKKKLLLILLIFGLFPSLKAQNEPVLVIFDSIYDISVAREKLVKEIRVRRAFLKRSKKSLLKQCMDSTRYYGGNCFKVTYYDDNESLTIKMKDWVPYYIRGEVYVLDESELQDIRTQIASYTPPPEVELKEVYESKSDSLMSQNLRIGFGFGLETGISAFAPKLSYIVFQNRNSFNTYYGGELTAFVFGGFFLSNDYLYGIQNEFITFESSVGAWWFPKTYNKSKIENYFHATLNPKIGLKFSRLWFKFGPSFYLYKNYPENSDIENLIGIAKWGNLHYNVELLIRIN